MHCVKADYRSVTSISDLQRPSLNCGYISYSTEASALWEIKHETRHASGGPPLQVVRPDQPEHLN